LTHAALASALKPAIASKQYGYEDQLSSLVAEAALAVMPANNKNFNVDNVRVVKIMGGSLAGSKVVQGMVFGREPEGAYFCFNGVSWFLKISIRYGEEGDKGQGCCFHFGA
jgi:chaperonin GroEL (HSP60 family)